MRKLRAKIRAWLGLRDEWQILEETYKAQFNWQ